MVLGKMKKYSLTTSPSFYYFFDGYVLVKPKKLKNLQIFIQNWIYIISYLHTKYIFFEFIVLGKYF